MNECWYADMAPRVGEDMRGVYRAWLMLNEADMEVGDFSISLFVCLSVCLPLSIPMTFSL